jgi:nitrate reductase beta subunit
MEISIGDYVRTDNGKIYKVEDEEDLRIHIKTEKIMFRAWVEDYYGCHKEDRFIVKHSKDIIDLIEEGDYVNGEPVEKIETGLDWGREITTTTEYLTNNEDIESIITKEQIKQIEYRIKEEV